MIRRSGRSVETIKSGKQDVLVATDVASKVGDMLKDVYGEPDLMGENLRNGMVRDNWQSGDINEMSDKMIVM
jgi:hypothetical protein